MDPTAPPSPASSQHDPYNLQELASHNAATSYPRDMVNPQHHMISLPPSRYSTPPIQSRPGEFGSPDHTGRSATAPLSGYGNQPGQQSPSPYGPLPDEIQEMQSRGPIRTQPYGTPATSPPTPKRRSVRVATRHRLPGGDESSGRNSPEPESPRRKAKSRNRSASDLSVSRPLSELAVEMGVEVDDMHKYVTRSVEERRQEIDRVGIKDRGRIKRPMNSFMLYRKAYQAMTKKYCGQDNHQVVSRVCGDSWRHLESDEFKAEFERLAKLDRAGHKAAWPDYKFKPAKPRGKKGKDGDEDDDPNWTFRRVHREEDPAFQESFGGYMSREHTPSMGLQSDMPSRHTSPPARYRRFGGSPESHSTYQPQRYMSGSPYSQPMGLHAAPDFDFNTAPGGLPFRGYTGRGEPHMHAGQSSHMVLAYDGLVGGGGGGDLINHHGLPDRHSPAPAHDEGLMYSPSDLLPDGEGSFANGAGNYHVAPYQQQQQQQQQYPQQHYSQHHQPRHQPQFYGQGHHSLAGREQGLQQSGRQASEPPLVDPSLLGPAGDMAAATASAPSGYAPSSFDARGKAEQQHMVAPDLDALGGLNETLMGGGAHGFDEWEITDWPAEGSH
ncbi:hypothetical protein RB595_001021 [Gaeumannomyces hyphopodioides]